MCVFDNHGHGRFVMKQQFKREELCNSSIRFLNNFASLRAALITMSVIDINQKEGQRIELKNKRRIRKFFIVITTHIQGYAINVHPGRCNHHIVPKLFLDYPTCLLLKENGLI